MIVGLLTFILMLLVYALIAYVVIFVVLYVVRLFLALPPKVDQILYAIAGLMILLWAITHLPVSLP